MVTLGSWRRTAGGGRALQSGAKSEAISHWSLGRVASLLDCFAEGLQGNGSQRGVLKKVSILPEQNWRIKHKVLLYFSLRR